MAAGALYSQEFYANQADGSSQSASVVVPIFLSLHPIKSIVDVGCGVGTWVREFQRCGVSDAIGIDGDYVRRSQLRISPENFVAHDLCTPLKLDRRFDAAVCLEVGEHLPERRAEGLVADLVALSPCVLFSAAVPGQGGTNHINEQYLTFWLQLFARHGYAGLDAIRPHVLGNDAVEWWYQQNVVVFAAPGHPLRSRSIPPAHSFIHPELYAPLTRPTIGMLVREFPRAVARSARFRLRRKVV
jgi:SAM-dependent methyltransferase